jgi:hypothetical protein
MPEDLKAKHKASLDEMLRLIDHTLKALPPKQKEGRRDVALRRWAMMLGVMMLNVGRTVSRLIETDDVVSILILGRSIYEYRLKAQYFFKDKTTRRLAFDQFMTIVTAYVNGLRRLPTLTPTLDQKLEMMRDSWVQTGGKADPYSGHRAVKTMALDLASPGEVKQDADGDKYTAALSTSYGIPSWYAHASAPLIAEFSPHWYDDEDWTFSETPVNHTDVLPMIRGIIADLFMYLWTVRKHYKIQSYDLKLAVERSRELMPPELRRRFEAMAKGQQP